MLGVVEDVHVYADRRERGDEGVDGAVARGLDEVALVFLVLDAFDDPRLEGRRRSVAGADRSRGQPVLPPRRETVGLGVRKVLVCEDPP